MSRIRPKAGSYHIRFPEEVTKWLERKRKEFGVDYVQDVVRELITDAYRADKDTTRKAA